MKCLLKRARRISRGSPRGWRGTVTGLCVRLPRHARRAYAHQIVHAAQGREPQASHRQSCQRDRRRRIARYRPRRGGLVVRRSDRRLSCDPVLRFDRLVRQFSFRMPHYQRARFHLPRQPRRLAALRQKPFLILYIARADDRDLAGRRTPMLELGRAWLTTQIYRNQMKHSGHKAWKSYIEHRAMRSAVAGCAPRTQSHWRATILGKAIEQSRLGRGIVTFQPSFVGSLRPMSGDRGASCRPSLSSTMTIIF